MEKYYNFELTRKAVKDWYVRYADKVAQATEDDLMNYRSAINPTFVRKCYISKHGYDFIVEMHSYSVGHYYTIVEANDESKKDLSTCYDFMDCLQYNKKYCYASVMIDHVIFDIDRIVEEKAAAAKSAFDASMAKAIEAWLE